MILIDNSGLLVATECPFIYQILPPLFSTRRPHVLTHRSFRHPYCYTLAHSRTQDQYFTHEHLIRPILHRPTFEAMVQARIYEKDQYFGALVLTVCACGSRWSNDPRTRAKDDMPNSAGWLYYEQVHRLPRPMSEPISLVRLQLFNVSAPCTF